MRAGNGSLMIEGTRRMLVVIDVIPRRSTQGTSLSTIGTKLSGLTAGCSGLLQPRTRGRNRLFRHVRLSLNYNRR